MQFMGEHTIVNLELEIFFLKQHYNSSYMNAEQSKTHSQPARTNPLKPVVTTDVDLYL